MLVYSAIDALTGRPRPATPAQSAARDGAPMVKPPALAPHEQSRIRAAQFRAKRLYPGPVGELIDRELGAWADFGYKFDKSGMAARLVDHILKSPLPVGGTS